MQNTILHGNSNGLRGRPALLKAWQRTVTLLPFAALLIAQLHGAEPAARAEGTLCVMTFNLRYASTNKPNAWPERRPVMRALVEKIAPDLMGTQEGLFHQLKDLASDLPQYSWLGLGRDGGSRGEFMAIFYRTSRFEVMEYDHFWLSDTPQVIASTTWGNTNRRMVTWIRFRDRDTSREFYLFNTHLDHALELARQKAADLIRQRIEGLKTDLPVLLIGDFNARGSDSRSYEILISGGFLEDAWLRAATRRSESFDTFHNYTPPRQTGFRIDWILSRGPWTVEAAEVVTFSINGQLPSDHFPVAAWMRLK